MVARTMGRASRAWSALLACALLAGCASEGFVPDGWVVVEGPGSLHPQTDERRLAPHFVGITPDGTACTFRVMSYREGVRGPLAGVEVITSHDEDAPLRKRQRAVTDADGLATIRDEAFLGGPEPLYVHFVHEGSFPDPVFERPARR